MGEISSNKIREIRCRNYFLNSQERMEGKIELKSLPISVMFPTGKRCNLKCKMCIDRKKQEDHKDLSFETFCKFDPGIEFALSVAIYGWVEPFLNPDYHKNMDYILQRYPGILIHISTNGTLINEKWRNKLVSTTNCFLNVSINAINKETYSKLTGYDKLATVITNLRALKDLKRKKNSKFPIITLSFILLKENINELPDFIKLAEGLDADGVIISDLIQLKSFHVSMSVEDIPGIALNAYQKAKSIIDYSDKKLTLTQFTDVPYLPSENSNICTDPWESFKIGENGEVSICCYANHAFGNILKQTITEIWNSEEIKFYRATVNTKNPPEPCQLCPKKRALFK